MDPSENEGPDENVRERAEEAREKKASGETLSRREAGILGAAGAMAAGAREERRAAREGRLDEYREEHRSASWMAGERARPPGRSDEVEREIGRIKEKREKEETRTRSEGETLGGAERAREERE